ncbi:MAG: ATP-binding protein [Kiritimatiellae bacterium]|nr:ATP-binding protein [Kiritimatiellia bacterium]
MVLRKREVEALLGEMCATFPAIAIMGPRQCGKTTLAKAFFSDLPYVSLEDPDVRKAATNDPRYFLGQYRDGAIFDEIQNAPELISYLQGIIDAAPDRMGRFILTGSRQFALMESMTQSLAGRIGVLTMTPFTWREWYGDALATTDVDGMIVRGLYPPILTRKANARLWYASYFQTYLERDVRQILKVKDLSTFELFVRLLAGRTGQELNLYSLGVDAGVSHPTAKSWVSVLEASGLVFLLPPYFRNYSKRLVKSPKLYFTDTGLACWLMGIETPHQLHGHPLYGPIFETAVVTELRKRVLNGGRLLNVYYWRDNAKLEIDLIEETVEGPCPLEIKSGRTYRSEWANPMRRWLSLTGCNSHRARIVYGGDMKQCDDGIEVVPWFCV